MIADGKPLKKLMNWLGRVKPSRVTLITLTEPERT
jgi:hypothetical protein